MTIRDKISRLTENNLRKKVVIPLLDALGAFATEDFHGPNEKGKDVYFAYKDLFGDHKHCCFFIKVGNIKKSGRNNVQNMGGAIEEAMLREFTSPLDQCTPVHINEFYFVCSGKVNQEARNYISELMYKKQMPNFKVFDIDKLTQIIHTTIKKYNPLLGESYKFQVRTFSSYCKRIVEHSESSPLDEISKQEEGTVLHQ